MAPTFVLLLGFEELFGEVDDNGEVLLELNLWMAKTDPRAEF
jgi:hypothetical protein